MGVMLICFVLRLRFTVLVYYVLSQVCSKYELKINKEKKFDKKYFLNKTSIKNHLFSTDFTKLFEYLKQLKGSVDIKKEVIRDVISESLRFKRKALAQLLEDFLVGLEKNGNSASVNLKRINSSYGNTNYHS